MTFPIKRQKIAVGVGYRAPNLNYSTVSGLDCALSTLDGTVDNIVFVCDLNINLLDNTKPGQKFITKFLRENNLVQIIKLPTRITETSATLIDHIYIRDVNPVIGTEVLDMTSILDEKGQGITDHHLVSCTLRYHKTKNPRRSWTGRNYRGINIQMLEEYTNNMPWEEIYNTEDINEKVKTLNSHIINVADIFAPIKLMSTSKRSTPWLTGTIQIMIKLKDDALKKFKRNNLTAAWKYYAELRNYTNGAVHREQQAYIVSTLLKCKKDPKKFWNNLEKWDIHSKRGGEQQDIPEELSDPDQLNSYYIEAAGQHTVKAEIIDSCTGTTTDHNTKTTLNFQPISTSDTLKIIQTIKTNATGIDGISLKMIYLSLPACAQAITNVINNSMSTGKCPDLWKIGLITPIPKVCHPKQHKDLRPITILPTMSKILEKAVHKQLSEHVEKNNILPDTQSGFRKNHSTTTVLLDVSDDILRAMEAAEVTSLVLLDYSRAFDTINHPLLIKLLNNICSEGATQEWFTSYLTRRSQSVVVKHGTTQKQSSLLNIPSGVPQGSILAPLLFTIYTADLPSIIKGCKIKQFADDTQIYYSFKPQDTPAALAVINSTLADILKWSSERALIINPSKTMSLLFGTNTQRAKTMELNFKITIDGTDIKLSDNARNLGLIMDSNLNYAAHVTSLRNKARFKLRSLYRFKAILPPSAKIILCDSLILSQINYCALVYGPGITKNNFKHLQKIQNSCARYSLNIKQREHITPGIRRAGWLKMAERLKLQALCTIHRTLVTGKPDYLKRKLNKRSDLHDINIRSKGQISTQHHRTKKYCASFTHFGTSLYNLLPEKTKTYGPEKFKKEVKKMYQLEDEKSDLQA